MRLALAQINVVVGDLDGNRERILSAIEDARAASAEIVVLPELAVTGYPPEDLLLRPAFVRAAEETTRSIAASTAGIIALVGTPWRFEDGLANACAVCGGGEVMALYRKRLLPNYGVFDEERYFEPGLEPLVLDYPTFNVGLTVCEDVWEPGPAADLAAAGAELLINLSASPFHVGKAESREAMLAERARANGFPVAFCNLVGGQDELVFDGHSVVLASDGEVLARAPGFEEHLLVVDVGDRGEVVPFEPELEQMRRALVLALARLRGQERLRRRRAGLSGGIDSALVAALAVDALGAERVHAVSMPSRYSSEGTQSDARRVAENLGCDFREIPIEEMVAAFHEAGHRDDRSRRGEPPGARARDDADVALERARLARARDRQQVRAVGRLLDALRRPRGRLRADQGRLQDRRLPARALPERARRPGADPGVDHRAAARRRSCAPDQQDQDSLPPYDLLDARARGVRRARPLARGAARRRFRPGVVERALALIDRAEYKRRQAPPGVKLRPKAFGRDRRTPITNRWQRLTASIRKFILTVSEH